MMEKEKTFNTDKKTGRNAGFFLFSVCRGFLMKLTSKNLKKFILEFLEEQTSEDSKKEVQDAFDNTSQEYMSKSLQQRNPGQQSAGSTFKEPQTPDSLRNADWKPLTKNPEAIKSPAKGFEAPIAGFLGAADIEEVSDNLEAVIQPAHAGKGIHRETGKLMAELAAVLPEGQPSTDFTTLIIGPTREEPTKKQVYTFHPGAPFASGTPIFMEDMKRKFQTEDDVIPIKIGEAKQLGFELVKHISSLPTPKTVKENKMKLTKQKLKQIVKEQLIDIKEMYYGWGAEWDPHTDQPGGGSGLAGKEETPSPSPSKSLKRGDKCPDCYGRGVQELEQWDSQMLTMVPYDTVECPTCKGTGKVLEETINETEDSDDESERFYAKMGFKENKMKLTKEKLKQLVREELEEALYDRGPGGSHLDEPEGDDEVYSDTDNLPEPKKSDQQKQIDAEAQRLYDEYKDTNNEQELWNKSKSEPDIIKTAAMLKAFGMISADKVRKLLKNK